MTNLNTQSVLTRKTVQHIVQQVNAAVDLLHFPHAHGYFSLLAKKRYPYVRGMVTIQAKHGLTTYFHFADALNLMEGDILAGGYANLLQQLQAATYIDNQVLATPQQLAPDIYENLASIMNDDLTDRCLDLTNGREPAYFEDDLHELAQFFGL